MKQIITITRTETVQLEIDTPQALTPKTIGELANSGSGVSGVGRLAYAKQLSSVVTPWAVPAASGKAKLRKGR